MSNYKPPAVLNPPLIGVMVLSMGIPIATFLLYYNTQVNEHERLEREERQVIQERDNMLGVINELDDVLYATRESKAKLEHHSLRFFRSLEDAERFLDQRERTFIDELNHENYDNGLRRTRLRDAGDEYQREFDFDGELGNYFTDAFVREYIVDGPFEVLQEFLNRIYSLQWTIRYPRAAYVDITLPEGVELPDFTDEEERERVLFDVDALPLFFESDPTASDPSRTGRVWFLCRPDRDLPLEVQEQAFRMTDDQKRRALSLATGHDSWERSIGQLQEFINTGRPMVPESVHYDPRQEVTCAVTGLPCEMHDIAPYFYLDRFEFQANRNSPEWHRMRVRFVIPIWDEEKAQATLAGEES